LVEPLLYLSTKISGDELFSLQKVSNQKHTHKNKWIKEISTSNEIELSLFHHSLFYFFFFGLLRGGKGVPLSDRFYSFRVVRIGERMKSGLSLSPLQEVGRRKERERGMGNTRQCHHPTVLPAHLSLYSALLTAILRFYGR